MSVLDSYLDTLFAPYPDSPQLRSARAELLAMMEDKRDALLAGGLTEAQAVGQTIAEFGSLEELAPALGIENDVDGIATSLPVRQADDPPVLPVDRAEQYAEAVSSSQWLTAIAVPLFVLSPLPMFVLFGTFSEGPDGDTPSWTVAVGLCSILVLVAAGVLLMMYRSTRLRDFEDIENGDFTSTPAIDRYARALRADNARRSGRFLATAVMCWVLAAVPLLVLAVLSGEDSNLPLFGVASTLVIVALGLWLWLHAAAANHAAEYLLQESDVDEIASVSSPGLRAVLASFWLVATAGYLAWSFIGDAWDRSWIVWPIAGVVYAALWAAISAAGKREEAESRG